jgi:rubredoxin
LPLTKCIIAVNLHFQLSLALLIKEKLLMEGFGRCEFFMVKAATTAKKSGAKKKPATAAKKEGAALMRYKCRVCGYVYSPLRGEPHNGIPAGTPFEDLPDTYLCPVCGFQGKGKVGKWGFDEWRPTRYICSMCDYIYDEKRGEPRHGIKPGTKFEDLPEDYVCPVCATDPKIVVRYGNVVKQGFSPLYE